MLNINKKDSSFQKPFSVLRVTASIATLIFSIQTATAEKHVYSD
jgi:hypothetical protein